MDWILPVIEFNETISYEIIFFVIGIYALLFWIMCVVYVWVNSKRYINSIFVRFIITLLAAPFGFFGLMLYYLIKSVFQQESVAVYKNICNVCDSDIDEWDNYCASCGTKVSKKCQYCNTVIFTWDKYCTNCGKKQIYKRSSKLIKVLSFLFTKKSIKKVKIDSTDKRNNSKKTSNKQNQKTPGKQNNQKRKDKGKKNDNKRRNSKKQQ